MRKISYIQFLFLVCFQVMLLHVLFVITGYKMYPQRNGTVLRINFPDDEPSYNDAIKIYSGPGILNEWKSQKKIFIPIDLTG